MPMLEVFGAFVVEITDDAEDEDKTKRFLAVNGNWHSLFDENIKWAEGPHQHEITDFAASGFLDKVEGGRSDKRQERGNPD